MTDNPSLAVLEARIDGAKELTTAEIRSVREAVALARQADKEALTLALAEINARLALLNESRGTVFDTVSRMMPRVEAEQRLGVIEKSLSEARGAAAQSEMWLKATFAILTLTATAVGIFLAFGKA